MTFIIKKPIAHTIRATPSVTDGKVKTNVSAKHAALVKNKHRKPEDHALAVSGVCVTDTPPHGPMRGNTMHSLTCEPRGDPARDEAEASEGAMSGWGQRRLASVRSIGPQ